MVQINKVIEALELYLVRVINLLASIFSYFFRALTFHWLSYHGCVVVWPLRLFKSLFYLHCFAPLRRILFLNIAVILPTEPSHIPYSQLFCIHRKSRIIYHMKAHCTHTVPRVILSLSSLWSCILLFVLRLVFPLKSPIPQRSKVVLIVSSWGTQMLA